MAGKHVPPQEGGLFGLLVLAGLVRFALCVVAFKQARDLFRNSHFYLMNLTRHYSGRHCDCETVPVRAFSDRQP